MPAIRFRYNNVCAVVVNEEPDGVVEVRMRDGDFTRITWLGFVCEPGVKFIAGARPGKIIAADVTNTCGRLADWRGVRRDQYVRGLIVQLTCTYKKYGAYAVVDRDGWPVVMG